MKILILIAIVFTLSFVAYNQDVFAFTNDCRDPLNCYALVRPRSSPVEGLEYELDSPDLWIDRNECVNIAVSSGWLVANPLIGNKGLVEWVESGVTKGDVRDVGCVTQLSTYYAINNVDKGIKRYQEYLVPNGRVDPGDNIKIKLQKYNNNQVQVFVTTPDITSSFPRAQVSLDPDNIYNADFGIEGTVSAEDKYSSIPMSKFTNMKIKQNGSWNDFPNSARVFESDPQEGFIGLRCEDGSFVAGTVMGPLECNVVATRNQAPIPEENKKNVFNRDEITIYLEAKDTDQDYLIYHLVTHPTNGFLDHKNKANAIENSDGDTAQLFYTPASSTPESDFFKFSVTDKRDGHTREGLVIITGPTPAPSIPDAVDDFRYTLSGTTINFSWSEPSNSGSNIKYMVERSYDSITWSHHDWYVGTTSFSYDRSEGYDQYFRVFAKNDNGYAASSNVINVHIPDTTPPRIAINNPNDGTTTLIPDILVEGNISENNNSGIEDIKIWIDSIVRPEPILVEVLSKDSFYLFDSLLDSVTNGDHLLMVTAENGDGVLGSKTISITVDAPIPKQVSSFEDNFESDMTGWYLATEDDEFWTVRENPILPVPGSLPGNSVAGTEDCDSKCTMTMIDYVDLTNMKKPQLDFSRYLSTSLDYGEGLKVYVSQDNGEVWGLLDSFMADDGYDDGLWVEEAYDLGTFSDVTEFKVRFVAISSSGSEDTELDNFKIYDAAADTTPPLIDAPPDQTFEATALLTPLDKRHYNQAMARDDVDPNPVINNDAPDTFPLGNTIITWTATDSSGNTSSATNTITVQDTTAPSITSPDNQTFEATAINTPLTTDDFGLAIGSDIVDDNVTVTNDAKSTFPLGHTEITWFASDHSGNSHFVKQSITIVDTTPPVITPPADITAQATGTQTTVNIGDATASDIFSVTITNDAPDTFPLGDTIITYTATDSNGNTSAVTQTILVEGNTAITMTSVWLMGQFLDITFTQDVVPYLDKSDFTLSSGEISVFAPWANTDGSVSFLMFGIPKDESLTITFVGEDLDIGDYTLYNGEYFVTPPNPGSNS